MKDIKIKKLALENFKCHKSLVIPKAETIYLPCKKVFVKGVAQSAYLHSRAVVQNLCNKAIASVPGCIATNDIRNATLGLVVNTDKSVNLILGKSDVGNVLSVIIEFEITDLLSLGDM